MIRNIVAAASPDGGIGIGGGMPWKNKTDMKRFVELTKGNAVVMGRKTYESIGHPLKDRFNVIVTSDKNYAPMNATDENMPRIVGSIAEAESVVEAEGYKEVYYIGGAKLFKELMDNDLADTVYLSIIKKGYENKFDTYFPYFDMLNTNLYHKDIVYKDDECIFLNIFRKRHESHCDVQYLNLLRDILENGVDTPTRVGTARSLFDAHLHFDLRKGLPVITTKKMALKSVVVELVWFLQGCKNIKYLVERNVHIWDKDAYAYYLRLAKADGCEVVDFDTFMKNVEFGSSTKFGDKVYTYGDVGVIYGSQWTDFDNSGINQLKEVMDKLKNDPNNRRLVVSAWNPKRMDEMALPPCHYAMEFYTEPIPYEERKRILEERMIREEDDREGNEEDAMEEYGVPKHYLSLRWIQRSCDMALGVPFNIMSYAVMLCVIAKTVNMIPKMLGGSLGNAHIYKNHIDGVKRMLNRNPYLFGAAGIEIPIYLSFDPFHDEYERLLRLEPSDIKITNYESYPTLKFDLFTDASKQV
jgi:thymidylate synthase/dihydrofolate reductase